MKVKYITFSEAQQRLEASVNRLEYTLDEWQKIRVHYMEDPVRQHFHPVDAWTRKQFYAYPNQCQAMLDQQRLTLQAMAEFKPN